MAEEGTVIAIHSHQDLTDRIDKARSSNQLVVIDFTASWCGPCRLISPFFDQLANKTSNHVFLKVDVDELKSVAEEFSVEAMPTFVLVWEGKVKDRVVGAAKDELCEKINNHFATTITTRA